MANKKGELDTNFVTPIGRASWAKLFKAEPMMVKGKAVGEPKFSITLIFEKSADLKTRHKIPARTVNGIRIPESFKQNVKEAIHNACVNRWGKDKAQWPANLQLPIHDGDQEKAGVDGYANSIFIGFSNLKRPCVVDNRMQPIVETDGTVYSGCYGRVSGAAFAWEFAGKNGVSLPLDNFMKTGDGEPFGISRRPPAESFGGFEDANDDDDSSDSEESYDEDDTDFG